jgi:hypothetical protein
VDDIPFEMLSRMDWLKLIAVAGQDVDLNGGSLLENKEMADIHAEGKPGEMLLDSESALSTALAATLQMAVPGSEFQLMRKQQGCAPADGH